MERRIGIVVPDDINKRLVDFCARYTLTPAEPYMTLVPPDFLTDARAVDRKLQSFCLSQPPFKTIIGGPNLERSDKGVVLYLSVMMGPLNTTRDNLINHLELQPGSFFRAQLVIISENEDSSCDFGNMLAGAKEVFSKAQEFYVRELALYVKNGESDTFKISSHYPFTGR